MATLRRASVRLVLLGALAALVLTSASASGASLVAKDGKIHACYKAKGKGKGTLRVVRNAKIKCPKKWKKTSWYAVAPAGPSAAVGPAGPTGPQGAQGEKGLPGTAGNVVVEGLEDKVTELLEKVQSLEAILKGVTNAELKEAIANIAKVETLEGVVGSLCTQASLLTTQMGSLQGSIEALNPVVEVLAPLFTAPAIPVVLKPYSCPPF
jgi:hypothetical protein